MASAFYDFAGTLRYMTPGIVIAMLVTIILGLGLRMSTKHAALMLVALLTLAVLAANVAVQGKPLTKREIVRNSFADIFPRRTFL